jgi:hypothetical protein
MIHSSTLAITTNGECLICGGFSLGKIVRFGSQEFITDNFDNLSFSPRGMTQASSSWERQAVGTTRVLNGL